MNDKKMQLFIAIKKLGITQTDLSKKIEGMNEARLSRIVNNHTQPTELEKKRISKALGVDEGKLGFREEAKNEVSRQYNKNY